MCTCITPTYPSPVPLRCIVVCTVIVLSFMQVHSLGLLGRAEASPTLITHTRKLLYLCMYICMYVCMYVAIHRPRVHHALRACAYRSSVKIVNVDSMLTLVVAHQSRPGEQNSSMNSQRVIAGRDLENSLLKGRRSRLYKQYTSLQSYYDHSLYNQPYCSAVTVELGYCTESVLGLVLASACMCNTVLLTAVSY